MPWRRLPAESGRGGTGGGMRGGRKKLANVRIRCFGKFFPRCRLLWGFNLQNAPREQWTPADPIGGRIVTWRRASLYCQY